MASLSVESTRSGIVESVHQVSVAVTDAAGRVVASAGEPGRVTFWRSAAKPFWTLFSDRLPARGGRAAVPLKPQWGRR